MDEDKSILVTGGLGYIGSHTIVQLHKAGYGIVILDNLINSSTDVLKSIKEIVGDDDKIHFYTGDVCDVKDSNLDYIFKRYNIEYVIHFAAYKSVPESVKEPLKYYHNNVYGLINLLDKMKQYEVKDIVFSSSCTVYGQPEKYPVTEKTPTQEPNSPYGRTKKVCEDLLIDSVNIGGFNAVILRYFNPIGCHKSGLLSDKPKGKPESLVPNIVEAIKGNQKFLQVYGSDYNTHDGTPVRDYIDVNDLAEAHVKSLKIFNDGYKIFNLGSGSGYSVLEIIDRFKKQGYNIPYKLMPRRPGDVEKIYADTTKANKILRWKPRTTLDNTIKSIINYLNK